MALITSAGPITQYLVAARAKLCPPTSERRVPHIFVLKFATSQMVAQDRFSLAYFEHVVIKNRIKTSQSI